jgi:hypothetical protein
MLGDASSQLFADDELNQAAFYPLTEVQMHLPMSIAEFTDFSCYEEHVGNVSNLTCLDCLKPWHLIVNTRRTELTQNCYTGL